MARIFSRQLSAQKVTWWLADALNAVAKKQTSLVKSNEKYKASPYPLCFTHILLRKRLKTYIHLQITHIHNNIPQTFMKLTTAILLPLLPAAINAWTLELGDQVYDGTESKVCTRATANLGSHMDWDRAWPSGCCLHLYADEICTTQNGYSCADWETNLRHDVKAFKVSNC
ncbi:hypothetical protein GMOD_00009943 [Pyrenophora seminiperda CCB06]|uniref:Uncharacterized protein n=1 Tax=Pyrenophora seminiperda CCB06 TaxID=1302712 RepID=A0A3M7M1I1_9PLEO|nr:hypothetical protein GMOD_00009943 [Pyrenophora seminiperda CCB06]